MNRKRRLPEYTPRGDRIAELNYVIRFKPEYLDKVLSGKKKITIRLGLVRPRFGEVLIVCNDLVYGIAEVKRVDVMKVEDLTDDIAKREGFRNKDELLRELKKLYPNVRERNLITLIEFEIREVFSRPKKLLEVIRQLKG